MPMVQSFFGAAFVVRVFATEVVDGRQRMIIRPLKLDCDLRHIREIPEKQKLSSGVSEKQYTASIAVAHIPLLHSRLSTSFCQMKNECHVLLVDYYALQTVSPKSPFDSFNHVGIVFSQVFVHFGL